MIKNIACVMGLCLINIAYAVNTSKVPANVRLYTLNCGTIAIKDGNDFSDTGFYKHKPLNLADPCYLIKHDNQWMLWDLGLGDKYLNKHFKNTTYGVTLNVSVSLVDQLKQLGLTTSDIKYVGISHAHFDHVGNINLFPNATLLMQQAEYDSIQKNPPPGGVESTLFPAVKNMHKILIHQDYDVFNDGSITLLSTPGHTPGHQSLEAKLPHTGTIILSGDLYHSREAYKHRLVPVHNASRANTIASMDHINSILKDTHGRLIIQHDARDYDSMPKFPQYLD